MIGTGSGHGLNVGNASGPRPPNAYPRLCGVRGRPGERRTGPIPAAAPPADSAASFVAGRACPQTFDLQQPAGQAMLRSRAPKRRPHHYGGGRAGVLDAIATFSI